MVRSTLHLAAILLSVALLMVVLTLAVMAGGAEEPSKPEPKCIPYG